MKVNNSHHRFRMHWHCSKKSEMPSKIRFNSTENDACKSSSYARMQKFIFRIWKPTTILIFKSCRLFFYHFSFSFSTEIKRRRRSKQAGAQIAPSEWMAIAWFSVQLCNQFTVHGKYFVWSHDYFLCIEYSSVFCRIFCCCCCCFSQQPVEEKKPTFSFNWMGFTFHFILSTTELCNGSIFFKHFWSALMCAARVPDIVLTLTNRKERRIERSHSQNHHHRWVSNTSTRIRGNIKWNAFKLNKTNTLWSRTVTFVNGCSLTVNKNKFLSNAFQIRNFFCALYLMR